MVASILSSRVECHLYLHLSEQVQMKHWQLTPHSSKRTQSHHAGKHVMDWQWMKRPLSYFLTGCLRIASQSCESTLYHGLGFNSERQNFIFFFFCFIYGHQRLQVIAWSWHHRLGSEAVSVYVWASEIFPVSKLCSTYSMPCLGPLLISEYVVT